MKYVVAGSMFLLAGVSAFGSSWDLTSDYLPNTNPNGAWTYGQYVGNSFSALSWTGAAYGTPGQTAFVYQNTGSTEAYGIGAGQVSIESDWGTAAVRWTAPTAGIYNITVDLGGTTANDGPGFGNNFAQYSNLAINGVGQTASSFNNNVMAWSLSNVSLAAGATVDAYVVNPGYAFGGNTQATFAVQSVPEPASMVALACGVVGLIKRRKNS